MILYLFLEARRLVVMGPAVGMALTSDESVGTLADVAIQLGPIGNVVEQVHREAAFALDLVTAAREEAGLGCLEYQIDDSYEHRY